MRYVIYIFMDIQTYFRRHQFSIELIPMVILSSLTSYNTTSTLALPFKLMTCRDSNYVYLWSPIVFCTDCSKPVASIVFNLTHCLQHFCNIFFRLLFIAPRQIGLILCAFISDFCHSNSTYIHTITTALSQKYIYSTAEILIMNKRNIKM